MGDISECQMQRLLPSAPDWCITGIHGTTGLITDNLQLTEIGLVQAQPPEVANYLVPPHRSPYPYGTSLGALLWDGDYSQVLGQRIEEHQTLRLVDDRYFRHSHRGYLPKDLVSHGALIWARDAGELRALRRFTGCIVSSGDQSGPVRPCLSGLSAELESTTDLPRRAVGVNNTGGQFESFDMDGPGGEVVTEIELPDEYYTRALKVC